MDHVEGTRGYGGAFFPPHGNYEHMKSGDELYFQQEYGQYFRFPLDRGPVTLQFREHDHGKADINIGTITITPDSLNYDSSTGISGTTVNEGVAVMDGPAVVELADSYGGREGEGALYHICYSVGFEDWCKPATTDGQDDPHDVDHGGVLFQPELGRYYNIVAKHSGKVIDVKGNTSENAAQVHQWEEAGVDNQLFKFEHKGDGYYNIVAKHSQKVLDVKGNNSEDGAHVHQWSEAGVDNQLFRIEGKGDGYYHIIARHSGKIFDVRGNSQENGAIIQQWSTAEVANQLFRFDPK